MMTFAAGLVSALAILAQAVAGGGSPDFSTAQVWPGSWSYRGVPGGSEALFVDASGGVRIGMRCTRASRVVTVSRTSSAPAPSLFIWTSSAERAVPARFEPNAMRVSADLAAQDGLLDAIAFSRGRIAISMPGAPPLVVKSSPETARVFEDCRN